ncbi:phenylalanine--tRNA ligase subunit beta, partial [Klebsiella pneumoniae]
GVDIELVQAQRAALHPGRTARVLVAGVDVGYVGELLPAVAAEADLPGRVLVAELDLDALLERAQARVVAASLSGFPAATQDVSVVVPAEVAAGDVR